MQLREPIIVHSNILQTLHQDHANQIQLLGFIEAEIGKFDHPVDGTNFELLALALEYCIDFPGHYHHPKEDLIYRKLVSRDPDFADRVEDLIEDHETLASLTRSVSAAVAAAISGGKTEGLRETGEQFARHYRYHIGVEETEIFPHARHALTEEDWREIENAYRDETDPLFGEHTRQAYIALQQCIVRRAENSA